MEFELRIELYILYNINFVKYIGHPTFGIDRQDFFNKLLSFLFPHADADVARQTLLAKTCLCKSLVDLYDEIGPMFADMRDTDGQRIVSPPILFDNDNRTRYDLAVMMLRLTRKYLNQPNGAEVLKISIPDQLRSQDAVVESFFKLNLERTSFSLASEKLKVELGKMIEYEGYDKEIEGGKPTKDAQAEPNRKPVDDIKDPGWPQSTFTYVHKVCERLDSFELTLARSSICILPRMALKAVDLTDNSPVDPEVKRSQSSPL